MRKIKKCIGLLLAIALAGNLCAVNIPVKLYLRTRKILSTIIGVEDFSVAEISCYYYYVSVSN